MNPVGSPDAVTMITAELLHDEIVNIQWNAPFSIDISTTDPDITYCLYIYNSSDESIQLYSRCNITITTHECELHPELLACAKYEIVIVAHNQVGCSNKTSKIVSYSGNKSKGS